MKSGSLCLTRGPGGIPYIKQVPLPPVVHPNWCGTRVGDIRDYTIKSKFLGDKRTYLVYLPPGYTEGDPWRYPVVYLADGQNVFDAQTSAFGVEWGVDEAAEQLLADRKLRRCIMVAVYNSQNRIGEYTPTEDPIHGGGEADRYLRFLLDELRPALEKTYSLSRRAADTAIIGSSLGGLLALYAGWRHSDVFGLVAALSPSLWWAGRDLVTAIAGDLSYPRGAQRIWLDMGTKESDDDRNANGVPDVLDDLRTLKAVLLGKGFTLDTDLFYREIDGGTHTEGSWAGRIHDVLCALLPPGTADAIY